MSQVKYWAILAAAGSGQRFGGPIPKQYQSLHGKPIIEHTLAKFLYHPSIEKIVISLAPKDYYWPQLRLDAYSEKIIVATGGAQRSHSVLAGLQAIQHLTNPKDFVLVHDAVRPCIQQTDIDKLITAVANHPVGGILGSRVRDTLKFTNSDNEIMDTMPRENVWQALTPQMFRFAVLYEALQQTILANKPLTDEAAAIEALGFIPMVVEGRRDNIKITFAEDLALAEKYL